MTDPIRLRPEARFLPESGIIAVVNYARGREGLIPLWAGEGDQPTPAFIGDAVAESLAAGETFYTYQRGLPELREALARYNSRLYGTDLEPERFFVTSSGMHAIRIAIEAIAGAGEEIVHFSPAWPNFPAAFGATGGRPRAVLLDYGETGWSLDPGKLEAAIGPNTRAVFVNTPSNPTGWTADAETLRAILDIARRHGLFVIADEIYSRFFYGGPRAPSFHDVMDEDDAILFVNSFSKNWAMTGWRIGWIEASPALGGVIENLVQYSSSGTPAFLQRGALAALEKGDAFVEAQIGQAREARDLVSKALAATGRVRLAPPEGAFYAFFTVDGIRDTRAAAFRIVDEARVGLAPGTAFGEGGDTFFRLCFQRRLDQIEEAMRRLADWIGTRP